MRTASVNHTPAVPYHTLIHGSLSTPSTIPFLGNTQYNTNSPPRYYHAHYSDKHSFIVVLSIFEAAEPPRNDKSAAINRAEINSLSFLYIGAFVPSEDERKD